MLSVIGGRTVRQLGQDVLSSLRTRGSQARTTVANQLTRDTLALRREQVKTALQRENLRTYAQSFQTGFQQRAAKVREGLKPENFRTTLQNTVASARTFFSRLVARISPAAA